MSISQAEKVVKLIADNTPAACSAAAGYLVRHNGQRVLFSDHGAGVPRLVSETRRAGRVTRAAYMYHDGSAIVFKWTEKSGARYTVVNLSTNEKGSK